MDNSTLKKIELFCEVDAILSACIMMCMEKLVEEKEEEEVEWGGWGGGGEEDGGE